MIVVIFVSARAHMRYLRCSLVIYALGGEFHNVTTSAVCVPLKDNILPLSYVTGIMVNISSTYLLCMARSVIGQDIKSSTLLGLKLGQ